MAAAALQLGLVEAASHGWLQNLFDEKDGEFPCVGGADGREAWNAMRSWSRRIIQEGLAPMAMETVETVETANTASELDVVVKAICEAGANRDIHTMWSAVESATRPEDGRVRLSSEQMMGVAVYAASNDVSAVKQMLTEHGSLGAADGLDGQLLVRRTLELCSEALERRGLGEEIFMEPLFRRLEKGANPAEETLRAAADGGMQSLIEHTKVRI